MTSKRRTQFTGILLFGLLMSDRFVMRKIVSSAPVCTPGSHHCQVLLSDLFDRAIRLSHYIYSLSSDMFEDFEHRYTQDYHTMRSMNGCHTASLSTPEDKDQALQIHHAELMSLVQKLLHSWNQPLQYLALEGPEDMARRAKEVEEHTKNLLGGVDRIAGRMQSNLEDDSYPQWFGPIEVRAQNVDPQLLSFYHLLHCFRRDSNKIDNFLKILRCRIVHANNC
ncbi:prolactin-like [Bombina bombina]|uniref:prolactin-like n=1 Tax=Bombina bombina TaxID=8345 RepID=UPI00235AD382|nr:prolactin-like [Bombina bombina]